MVTIIRDGVAQTSAFAGPAQISHFVAIGLKFTIENKAQHLDHIWGLNDHFVTFVHTSFFWNYFRGQYLDCKRVETKFHFANY